MNTKPELQIRADDVKCSHGATIGQLDEDALFYLRSRGLDRQRARDVLVHAFGADIVGGIRLEALRRTLADCLFPLPDAEGV
jgi:Fe-S cluster assembly protein SufD